MFYDGHPLAAFSQCFGDLTDLVHLDWAAIDGTQFANHQPDIKRKKQAELLVWNSVPRALVRGIAVCNNVALQRVQATMQRFPTQLHKPAYVVPHWYF